MTPLRGALFALLLSLPILLFPGAGEALDYTPFATRNQSPLVRIFGLPAAAGAELLPQRHSRLTLTANLASNDAESAKDNEAVLLDGESYLFQLGYRYAVSDRIQVGIDLPYIVQEGGFLDSFIEDFHAAFGFPQGSREDRPHNQLLYRYERTGEEPFVFDRNTSGFGDLTLTAACQLLRTGTPDGRHRAVALHGQLKLPTGDSDRLLGSGGTDFALWLSAVGRRPLRYGELGLYAAGGALYLSPGDVLEDRQHDAAGFGSLGIGWSPPWPWILFKAQIDGHTALFRSGLREVGGDSLQLTLGGSLGGPATSVDIGVTEDIIVAASPDVVFHFALCHTF